MVSTVLAAAGGSSAATAAGPADPESLRDAVEELLPAGDELERLRVDLEETLASWQAETEAQQRAAAAAAVEVATQRAAAAERELEALRSQHFVREAVELRREAAAERELEGLRSARDALALQLDRAAAAEEELEGLRSQHSDVLPLQAENERLLLEVSRLQGALSENERLQLEVSRLQGALSASDCTSNSRLEEATALRAALARKRSAWKAEAGSVAGALVGLARELSRALVDLALLRDHLGAEQGLAGCADSRLVDTQNGPAGADSGPLPLGGDQGRVAQERVRVGCHEAERAGVGWGVPPVASDSLALLTKAQHSQVCLQANLSGSCKLCCRARRCCRCVAGVAVSQVFRKVNLSGGCSCGAVAAVLQLQLS